VSAAPRAAACLLAVVLAGGCAVFQDNATHLAYALAQGARELRESPAAEHIVRYTPLGGSEQAYEITIRRSRALVRTDIFGNIDKPGGSSIVVTGAHRGGTGYHERFVFTPSDLHIAKTSGATEVVLRKVGERIDVVEIR
jgi:hypothetical protein